MNYQVSDIEAAFQMLLETVQFGVYTFADCKAQRKNGVTKGNVRADLFVRIRVADPSIPSNTLAENMAAVESNLKRACFDFFARSGVLVTPKVVVIAAGA